MRVGFGHFTLDSDTREVLEDGRVVHLSPKAFEVLRLLLERRPAVVTKDELFAQVWQRRFVEDASLNVVITEIRRALSDDPKSPRFVRTSHGKGYAFSGPATGLAQPAGASSAGSSSSRCWLAWNDQTFPLLEGENVVGRDPRCTVWVDASGVSRRHARISVAADAVTLEDLESRNGVFLRAAKLSGPHRLVDGDEIELGTATMKFRMWSDDSPPQTERIRRE
jgi:DNA-binding winged helix-turn-helix (wHTH) protein